MKKFGISLFALFICLFSGFVFTACSEGVVKAQFTQTEIVLEMGKEYNPFDYVESLSKQQQNMLDFNTQDDSVAYVNESGMLVAVGFGKTTLYVEYHGKEIASCSVSVPKPPIPLSAPTNLHYDETMNALTWSYSMYEFEGSAYVWHNYELELKKGADNWQKFNVFQTNLFTISDIGSYQARIKAVSENEGFSSSEYSGIINFNLMAAPKNLSYNPETNTLTWDTNSNPENTQYQVHFSVNGGQTQSVPSQTNALVLPVALAAGTHTFQVITVPFNDTYFKNQSEVFEIKKLAVPTVVFNNGIVSWQEVEEANSYLVEVFNGNDKTDEEIVYASIGTNSDLPRTACLNSGANYSVCVTAIGSPQNNVFSSEKSAHYAFEKLGVAEVLYNQTNKMFEVVNVSGASKIELASGAGGALVGQSSVVFVSTSTLPFILKAQLVAVDPSQQIDGEVATTFKMAGSDEIFTTIQNLSKFSARYQENNDVSFVVFTEIDEGCNYKLIQNNSALSLTANLGEFNLGETALLFADKATHKFEIVCTKAPQNQTVFVESSAAFAVSKLSSPTTLTIQGNKTLALTDLLPQGAQSVYFEVNGQASNTLNLEESQFLITAKYIAQTSSNQVNLDGENINMFYSSSAETSFEIKRIEKVSGLSYDYTTKVLYFDKISNASSYEVRVNGIEVMANNEGGFVVEEVGEISVIALPEDWQPIKTGVIGYLKSLESTITTYKIGDITSLALMQESDGAVTAKWQSPAQTYGKDLSYSVYVSYENQDFLLEAEDIDQTQYTFNVSRFDQVGNYIIKVQIESKNQDFFTTPTLHSLELNRLEAPKTLTRVNTNEDLVLEVSGFDLTKMSEIKFIEDIDGVIREFTQKNNQYPVNLQEGQTLTLKVAFVGAFDNKKFNLGSLATEFKVYQIAKIKSAELVKISQSTNFSRDFSFSWEPAEEASLASGVMYEYRKVANNVLPSTTTATQATVSDTTGLSFTFGVKAIAKNNWTKINAGGMVYLSNDSEYQVVVHRENKVFDVQCDMVENNVVVSFKYNQIEDYTIGQNLYNPVINLVYKNIVTDTEEEKTITNLNVNKITQSAFTTRQDPEGFYEYAFKLSGYFNDVGKYTISISAESILKTLRSESVVLNITKLAQVQNLKIVENTGTFVAANGEEIDLTGTEKLVVSGDISEVTGTKINLEDIAPNKTSTITVHRQGIMDNSTLTYNFNSQPTTFALTRVAANVVQIDTVTETLYWPETQGLPDGVSYSFKIEGLGQFFTNTNKISFSDDILSMMLNSAGTYFLSVQTIVPQQIIGEYNGANSVIGYVSSEYGNALTVEKLAAPQNVKVENTSSGVKLSWQEVFNAKEYNVYLSTSASSKGTLVNTTADTSIICDDWFSVGTQILRVEAVSDGKITSALSDAAEVTTLKPLTILNITPDGILSWNKSIDSQLLPAGVINIQVYDANLQVQFDLIVENSASSYNLLAHNQNLFIKNLLGGTFVVKMNITGASNTNQTILTLDSAFETLNVQKLFAPTLEIVDNCVKIIDTNGQITDKKYHLEIKTPNATIFNDWYAQPVYLENIATSYEIISYCVSETESVINSNSTTLEKVRLTIPQNLALTADENQEIVTLSWNEVENASGYQVFVNNQQITTTSQTVFVFDAETFKNAGSYEIVVKAVSGTELYSLSSKPLSVVRLNPAQNGYITPEAVVEIGTAVQTVQEYKIYIELQDLTFKTLLQTEPLLPATQTSFGGLQGELQNFAGGSFYVVIGYVADGIMQNEMLVLSSKKTTFAGFKLFAPTIQVNPDKVTFVLNDTIMPSLNGAAGDVSNVSFEILCDGEFALDEKLQPITNLDVTEFVYPSHWKEGEYTISAKAVPTVGANVLASNANIKTTTRLEAPQQLKFERQAADVTNYSSDIAIEYMSSIISFEFDKVTNANGYILNNGQKDYSNSLITTNKFDITFSSNFEEFVYGGNNLISVVAVAPVGGEYINSAPSTISFSVLEGATSLTTNGTGFDWQTFDTNFNGFLVMSIDTSSEKQKFWQAPVGQNSSTLQGLIVEGINSLNIKTFGNVTTNGISQNIVLDSQFMAQNQQFTKLAKIQNIGTHQGMFNFAKNLEAEEYLASVFEDGEKLLEVPLKDYTKIYKLEVNEDVFVGYATQIANLNYQKTYTIKIQVRKYDSKYLFSDLSDALTFKVLENKHHNVPLVLTPSAEHQNQLDKKVINVLVDTKAQGMYVSEGEVLSTIGFANTLSTYAYMPTVSTSGPRTYTFVLYGTTNQSMEQTHYTLSAPCSITFRALEQPIIKIKNGIVIWTEIWGADGYYVYINDVLYKGKIYNETKLDLPSEFVDDNTRFSIAVVPVAAGNNTLWGVKRTFGTTHIVEENEQRFENNFVALKPHKPNSLQVVDGALLYSAGINSLDAFSMSHLEGLFANLGTNLNETSVAAFEDYIEGLFASPVNIFSKYSGFCDIKFDLTLTDITGFSYTYETSAYKFLKLSPIQQQNLENLVEFMENNMATFIENLGVNIENELYDYVSPQTFVTEKQYYAARLKKLVSFFENSTALENLKLVNQQNRFPSPNVLFEEFESFATASLVSGTYGITLKQKGTTDDVLHSAISDVQEIYVPSAPQEVSVVFSDYNYHLVFNSVQIDEKFAYNSKFEDLPSTNVVYMLFGEGDNTPRTLLCETLGTNFNGQLSLSLTNLIDSGVLTPDINKIYLVVKGNTFGDSASQMVITGKKSAVIDVTVLPQAQPLLKDGVMQVESVFDSDLLPDGTNVGFELTGQNFEKEIIFERNWTGATLRGGQTYALNIRFIGIKPTVSQTNNFVLSGPKMQFNVQKLLPMMVDVNAFGVFEWAKVENSAGFVLSINNASPVVFSGESITTYESVLEGFNNFKFQSLGSNAKIANSENVYYLNSEVNNSLYGLDGVMLDGLTNSIIQEGLIKWTPHAFDRANSQNTLVGYKLCFSNEQTLYSTLLTSKDFFKDAAGNWCFDFSDYGQAGAYTLTIQPYIQSLSTLKPLTTQHENKTFTYLLGTKYVTNFEKIAAPQDIHIENGELVWAADEEIDLFGYKFVADSQEITGTTTNFSVWEERLTPETKYNFFVRAYQAGKVFSSYALYANIDEENTPLTATKLAFDKPIITKTTESNGNIIQFSLPASAINMAINLKYRVQGDEQDTVLKYGDAGYENVITIKDNIVKINVSQLRNGIESMDYYLQLVPVGNTEYLCSNFTSVEKYVTPKPLTQVLFDENKQEFFFEAQTYVTYNIKDEIINADGQIEATYFYEVTATGNENFFGNKTINGEVIKAISFAPTVVGFNHKVSVAVVGDGSELMSPYATCETIYFAGLFGGKTDVFETLKSFGTKAQAQEYFALNAFGDEGNPYLIENKIQFANINLRLEKYAYQNTYSVVISGASYDKFEASEKANFVFNQTRDIVGVSAMIGIKQASSIGSVKYLGFGGTYDGLGRTITYNLVSSSGEDAALFGVIESTGIIRNLKVNANIELNDALVISGLAAENNGRIENVTISEFNITNTTISTTTLTSLTISGVVGVNKGTIQSAFNFSNGINFEILVNNLTVTAAGIVAQNESTGKILQSGNKMNVTLTARLLARVGGVAGYNNGTIQECYNAAQISAVCTSSTSNTYVGGLVGYNDINGFVKFAYVKGEVMANSSAINVFAGGVIGYTKNAQMMFAYSAIEQIVVQSDSSGTTLKSGGTLCGYVDTTNATHNKNYYAHEAAFGREGDETMFDAEYVNVGAYNALANLVETINFNIGESIFVFNGQDIVFAYEKA